MSSPLARAIHKRRERGGKLVFAGFGRKERRRLLLRAARLPG
jgi:hypothetical protein